MSRSFAGPCAVDRHFSATLFRRRPEMRNQWDAWDAAHHEERRTPDAARCGWLLFPQLLELAGGLLDHLKMVRRPVYFVGSTLKMRCPSGRKGAALSLPVFGCRARDQASVEATGCATPLPRARVRARCRRLRAQRQRTRPPPCRSCRCSQGRCRRWPASMGRAFPWRPSL